MDRRGVSSVIGTVLLVAVVVVLATVIVVAALAVFTSPDAAPTAEFRLSETDNGLVIVHTHGDEIDSSRLYVRGEDPDGDVTFGSWQSLAGTETVSAGDTLRLPNADFDETITLVYRSPEADQSAILEEYVGDAAPNVVTESAAVANSTRPAPTNSRVTCRGRAIVSISPQMVSQSRGTET